MYKLFAAVALIASIQANAQSIFERTGKVVTGVATGASSTGKTNFTENEAAQAIKQALTNGINTAVTKGAATDGFFRNQFIKVLFPPEARAVESTLRRVGAGALVDNVILSMNRAAEQAAPQAKQIFINSVSQLTVTDAINMVSNQQQDAATRFLERTTTNQLVAAFKPSIATALDKTLATKYWRDAMTQYNRIPFVQRVNTDLPDYVTRKAVSGLFYLIAEEEARIRKDPVARTTDILQKVFGNIKL